MNKKIIQILLVLCTTNIITACNSGGIPNNNDSNQSELKGGLFSKAPLAPTISYFTIHVGSKCIKHPNNSIFADLNCTNHSNHSAEWSYDFYNKISQSKLPVYLTINELDLKTVQQIIAIGLPENVYALNLRSPKINDEDNSEPGGLTNEDLKKIAPLLKNITDLTYERASRKRIYDNDDLVDCLTTLLQAMPELDTLTSKYNSLGYDHYYDPMGVKHLRTIVKSMPNARNLKSLTLEGEHINDYGASIISNSFPALTKLDLTYNKIAYNGFKEITKNLRALTDLNLSNNINIAYYTKMENHNLYQGLTKLNLSGTGFEDKPSKLKYILSFFPNLSSLSFHSSKMSEEHIEPIVRSSPNLTYLDLSNNWMIPRESLNYMIKKLPKLKYLDITDVNFVENLNVPRTLKVVSEKKYPHSDKYYK